jgi:hypothetical protein
MSNEEPEPSTNVSTDGKDQSDKSEECFVIAPIGRPQSETRKQTDGPLDEAIRPVVEDRLGLGVVAQQKIAEDGGGLCSSRAKGKPRISLVFSCLGHGALRE